MQIQQIKSYRFLNTEMFRDTLEISMLWYDWEIRMH